MFEHRLDWCCERDYVDGIQDCYENPRRAQEPLRTCYRVFADLLALGVQKEIAMMGVSAGCDQLLSILSGLFEYGADFTGRFAFITLIAGAWHPTLYPLAADVSELMTQNTKMILLLLSGVKIKNTGNMTQKKTIQQHNSMTFLVEELLLEKLLWNLLLHSLFP